MNKKHALDDKNRHLINKRLIIFQKSVGVKKIMFRAAQCPAAGVFDPQAIELVQCSVARYFDSLFRFVGAVLEKFKHLFFVQIIAWKNIENVLFITYILVHVINHCNIQTNKRPEGRHITFGCCIRMCRYIDKNAMKYTWWGSNLLPLAWQTSVTSLTERDRSVT